MAKKILFSLVIFITLGFVSERVIFGASGEMHIIPPTIPGTIAFSDTVASSTGGTTLVQKNAKLPISKIQKKRFALPGVSDDKSIYRFISRSVPLTDTNYEPTPLMSISGAHINQAGRSSQLRKDARIALGDLAAAFEKKFGEPLVVISGYRSAAYQQRLWDLGRCTDSLCAPPGHSEHQLGLAVDLFDATTEDDFLANGRYRKYVTWLQANAHLYGWHQSYQKGEAVDEYEVEPWHWRYIGVDMATRLKNLGWTYTEYVRFNDTMLGW